MYTMYSLSHLIIFRVLMKSVSLGSNWVSLIQQIYCILNTSYLLGTILGTGHLGVSRTRNSTFIERILKGKKTDKHN